MVYELAARSLSGIKVRLLWDAARNQVMLHYRDGTSGDRFVTDVPNTSALSAFNHPNAYRPRVAA
jgi:hypothetical protein